MLFDSIIKYGELVNELMALFSLGPSGYICFLFIGIYSDAFSMKLISVFWVFFLASALAAAASVQPLATQCFQLSNMFNPQT